MGPRPGAGLEHPRIARARHRRAQRNLLVALAPGAVGKGRDVGQHAGAGARGLGLRSRCAAVHRAATRRRILSPRAAGLLAVGIRSRRPCGHHHAARRPARAGIGNREVAGGPRAARCQAPGGSRRVGPGQRARRCGARDRRRAVSGARGTGARRRYAARGRGGALPPAWGGDSPADGREIGSCHMSQRLLPVRSLPDIARRRRDPVTTQARADAGRIVDAVRTGGEGALREYAERFGDVRPGAPLFHERTALGQALALLPAGDRERLERVAERIRRFAEAQRRALCPVSVPVPGGVAEHRIAPVERVGCYAPGGRYPLPLSVLMTAVTARVAGVRDVWVASPKPQLLTLAAAAVAGADGLVAAGGAQAIAALGYGAGPITPRDLIVGPGNRYVTAAKQLVAGAVAIDMLAGPSELTVFADDTADPSSVAADLLAQAEHDPDAVPFLVTLDPTLADRVEQELTRQLRDLPTADTARTALANGGVIVVAGVDDGVAACDAIAPEHVQLELREAAAVAPRLAHYGALFVGAGEAEVLGDYGAGPNHVLPTGGTARSTGGLSVYTFLRVRTWLRIDDRAAALPLIEDAVWLARAEGLEAHARAAERRLGR